MFLTSSSINFYLKQSTQNILCIYLHVFVHKIKKGFYKDSSPTIFLLYLFFFFPQPLLLLSFSTQANTHAECLKFGMVCNVHCTLISHRIQPRVCAQRRAPATSIGNNGHGRLNCSGADSKKGSLWLVK
jgi:hypothetical protein